MDIRNYLTKRNILTAAVILVGLLLIVLVLVLAARGPKTVSYSGGEGSQYPYSWTEFRDGTVSLSPYQDVPEGYSWNVAESDDAVIKVSQAGKSSFTVTPAGEGDSYLRLYLSRGQESEDRLAELLMTVESLRSGKKLSASVTGHHLEVSEGILRGGEEYGASYTIRTDENGDLQIRVYDSEDAGDWNCLLKSPDTLASSGASETEGEYSLRVFGMSQGDARLTVYSYSRGLSLDISGNASADGSVTAESCEMTKHEDWADMDESAAAASLLTAGLNIPEGAEDCVYSVKSRLLGGRGPGGSVSFKYLDAEWQATVTENGSFTEQLGSESYNTDIMAFFTEAGPLYAYFDEDGSVTAWCDAETYSYLFEADPEEDAEAVTPAALIETACLVMGASSAAE